jgi:hypothetical protein
MPKRQPDDLDYANLITALEIIAKELKRHNDILYPLAIERREPEFGRASYINRIRVEQTDELHAALDPFAEKAKQIKARTSRRYQPPRQGE